MWVALMAADGALLSGLTDSPPTQRFPYDLQSFLWSGPLFLMSGRLRRPGSIVICGVGVTSLGASDISLLCMCGGGNKAERQGFPYDLQPFCSTGSTPPTPGRLRRSLFEGGGSFIS